MKKSFTYDQALYKAAALCSRGEHCPSDIFQKVQEWGLPANEASKIVSYLIEEKYLDEKRFVHAFVNDKFTYQHWGRVKISYALRLKGTDDVLIANAMDEVIEPEAYLAVCTALIQSKIKGMELPLSQADRAKVYRFAAQRGFESSVISKSLSKIS